jgi:hypothetical protein
MWLLLGISEPVAEFLNLICIIIALLLRPINVLLVKYIIDICPHVRDVPIASTVSSHWAHGTSKDENLLESDIGNELG